MSSETGVFVYLDLGAEEVSTRVPRRLHGATGLALSFCYLTNGRCTRILWVLTLGGHPQGISWQRWTVLAMLAYAFLAVLAAAERAEKPTPQDGSMIALTCNEIHRLFNTFIAQPIHDLHHRLHWSLWRRRHQHRARTSHYQRRAAAEP